MIKHIVMFRLKESMNEDDKKKYSRLIRSEIEKLPALIKEIKYMQAGINIKPSERAFDVVLVSEFENLETLKIYSVHPDHLKFIETISPYREKVAVVDYEF